MTRDEIERFVTRYAEAWKRGDVRALAGCYADKASVESPMLGKLQGRVRIESSFRDLFRIFADWDIEIDRVLVDTIDRERAALIARSQARHVGEAFGYPGSGREFSLTAVFLFEFSGDRIVSEKRLYDFTGLLVQLGVLKATGRL